MRLCQDIVIYDCTIAVLSELLCATYPNVIYCYLGGERGLTYSSIYINCISFFTCLDQICASCFTEVEGR